MENEPVACQDFVRREWVDLQELVVLEHVVGEHMRQGQFDAPLNLIPRLVLLLLIFVIS
jgi:hypothetical protein